MYEQKHIELRRFTGDKDKIRNVVFCGNKAWATDSFRLVEILASGEPHEPVAIDGQMLKAVKVSKGRAITTEDMKITPDSIENIAPNVEKLKETFDKEEYISFGINADYLAEILQQLGKLAKHKIVEMRIPKKYIDKDANLVALPIVVKAPDAIAYVMPAKYK